MNFIQATIYDLHLNECAADIPGRSKSVPVTTESALDEARRQRHRALIIPREHGAWGLLLVPMITGAGVAFRECSHIFPLILLSAAALALFWLRTPAESLLGTSAMRAQTSEEARTVKLAIAILGAIAGAALCALLWAGKNRDLWPLGAVAAVAFIAQALLKRLGRRARIWSEMVGTIGLTAAAPAAYYVITGNFNETACMLWLANILFAGDQIHYVQLRIHTAKVEGFRAKVAHGWAFALGQALMTAVLTLACMSRLMPAIVSLAFAPLLFRGWFYFVQEPSPLLVRRLGWGELKHATVFCIVFVGMYTLAR